MARACARRFAASTAGNTEIAGVGVSVSDEGDGRTVSTTWTIGADSVAAVAPTNWFETIIPAGAARQSLPFPAATSGVPSIVGLITFGSFFLLTFTPPV
jgi:hypothetical protein